MRQCAHCPWPWTQTIFSGRPQDGHCGCKIGFGLGSYAAVAWSGICSFIFGCLIWGNSVIRLSVRTSVWDQMIPQNANRCKTEPNQTRICLVKTRVNTGLIEGQSIQTLFESSREQRKSMMRVPTASSARQDFSKQQLKLLINLVFFYLTELMSASKAINSCLKHNNTSQLINQLLS